MDSFFKMVDVQTVLFIYMAVGFFCRKKGIFNDAARDKLTDFVVLITLPCMIFESFHMEFSLESLKQGGVAVLIATAMAAAALLLGKVLYNRFPYQEKSISSTAPWSATPALPACPWSAAPTATRASFWAPCSSSPPASSCGAPASPCLPRPTPSRPSERCCSTPASSPWRWAGMDALPAPPAHFVDTA